jgi:hypothetical protein
VSSAMAAEDARKIDALSRRDAEPKFIEGHS